MSREGSFRFGIASAAAALCLGLGLWCADSARGQVERRGGGENAALMAQYQQLQTERAQLQSDNAQLKQQLQEAQKQLALAKRQVSTLQSGSSSTQAALQQAQAASRTYQKSFEDTRGRLQDLLDHFRQTVATMQGIELSRDKLQQQLAEQKAAFGDCARRNVQLYRISNQVLDRYEHQGMFSYLERAEPFTRLKRTQIQNLVDDYREQAQEQRLPATGAAAAAPSPSASAGGGPASAAASPTGGSAPH